jgi:hypothetical protein
MAMIRAAVNLAEKLEPEVTRWLVGGAEGGGGENTNTSWRVLSGTNLGWPASTSGDGSERQQVRSGEEGDHSDGMARREARKGSTAGGEEGRESRKDGSGGELCGPWRTREAGSIFDRRLGGHQTPSSSVANATLSE